MASRGKGDRPQGESSSGESPDQEERPQRGAEIKPAPKSEAEADEDITAADVNVELSSPLSAPSASDAFDAEGLDDATCVEVMAPELDAPAPEPILVPTPTFADESPGLAKESSVHSQVTVPRISPPEPKRPSFPDIDVAHAEMRPVFGDERREFDSTKPSGEVGLDDPTFPSAVPARIARTERRDLDDADDEVPPLTGGSTHETADEEEDWQKLRGDVDAPPPPPPTDNQNGDRLDLTPSDPAALARAVSELADLPIDDASAGSAPAAWGYGDASATQRAFVDLPDATVVSKGEERDDLTDPSPSPAADEASLDALIADALAASPSATGDALLPDDEQGLRSDQTQVDAVASPAPLPSAFDLEPPAEHEGVVALPSEAIASLPDDGINPFGSEAVSPLGSEDVELLGDAAIHEVTTGDIDSMEIDVSVPAVKAGFVAAPTAFGVDVDALDAEVQGVKRRAERLRANIEGTIDDQQRLEQWLELGALSRDHLADSAEAAECFRQVLALDPIHQSAFKSLAHIYQLEWQTELLIELLLDRQDRLPDADSKLELLERVIELYEQIADAERARVVIDAALALAPDDPGLIDRRARIDQQLDASRARALARETDGPSTQLVPRDPLELLEKQLEQSESDGESIELLEQMGALCLRRGHPDEATRHLYRVLQIDERRDSTYRKIEAIYRQSERSEDLAATLERHAEAASPAVQLEILRELAPLYSGPLRMERRALETHERIRALAPSDPGALAALRQLYQRLEQWRELAGVLEELLETAPDGPDGVRELLELGKIRLEHLDDVGGAEHAFQDVLGRDGNNLDAMAALGQIYRQRGDWGKTVRLLESAADASKSPTATADYLLEASQLHLRELDDTPAAEKLLRRALQADPDHAPAARVYAELLFARGSYHELRPVLEVVRRKTSLDDHQELVALHHQLGVVAAKLGETQVAAKHLQQVLDLAPGHVATLAVMADLALDEQDWPRAHQALRRLDSLDAWPQGAEGDARRMQLADCEAELGNKSQAIALVSELLERRPEHPDALERLANLKADSSDWTAVLQAKKALLGRANEDDEWCRIQIEIGDILHRELGRANDAESAYRAGLERRGDDRGLLHRLLDLYSGEKRWKETIEICERVAAIETEPANKAKYLGTAAHICDRELDQVDEALRYYNRALDANPEELKAFEAVDKICTRQRDWRGLQQNYGRMLQRLPEDGKVELKVMLWHNLGEVMRSRRRDFESAMAAFEVAQKLMPSPERAQILAELYLNSGAKYLDKAIAAHHQLLDSNPHRVSFYKSLRNLYMESGRYDEAWGFCSTLSFMQKADEQEEAFFRQYRRRRPPQAKARLTEDALQRHLYHPSLDPYLSAALALMAPATAVRTARSHSDFKLKRKERVDPASIDHPFCRIFAYACAVLNAPQVDFFVRPEWPASLQIAHTTEATSFVAGAHALAEGRDERQLAFIAGCQLSFLLPSLFLRVALPSRSALSIAFIAGLRLINPNVNIPAEHRRPINKLHDLLRRRLRPHQLDQLKELMSHLAAQQKVDLDGWWRGAELTADRAGLLLCGDLETATRVVGMEPSSGGIPARERASELVRFSTSQSYFTLRRQMGLTIEGQ